MSNQCGGDNQWALWPMPDSKTLHCTDGTQTTPCPSMPSQTGYGQDGSFSLNVPDYVISTDVVVDPVTSLMWERAATSVRPMLSWADAQMRCQQLSLAGFEDWRLPSRIEIVSLNDMGAMIPLANPQAFPNTTADSVWTSSSYAFDSTKAWIGYWAGGALTMDKNMLLQVRCVRNQ